MQSPSIKKTWLAFWVGGVLGILVTITVNYFFISNITVNAEIPPHPAYGISPQLALDPPWFQELPATSQHIKTPDKVRGIYLSAWSTGLSSKIDSTIDFINSTKNLNTVIIDLKDSTGVISYTGNHPKIKNMKSYSNRIRNLEQIIRKLHENNIYVIGRVTSFEDPLIAGKHDEFVLKTTQGEPWHNNKGKRSWVDPSNKEYWNYLVALAREAHSMGIDEINFDYLRYPSEGPVNDIQLPDGKSKIDVITEYVTFLNDELRSKNDIVISADVFGLTTTNVSDFGIGQVWENIIVNMDYILPMVYPSHYANGSFGFDNPAKYPYQVMRYSIQGAINKTKEISESVEKIRPWIQDFDLGAVYREREVRDQLQALEELGIDSYLVWDPRNVYTQSAYTLLP